MREGNCDIFTKSEIYGEVFEGIEQKCAIFFFDMWCNCLLRVNIIVCTFLCLKLRVKVDHSVFFYN